MGVMLHNVFELSVVASVAFGIPFAVLMAMVQSTLERRDAERHAND